MFTSPLDATFGGPANFQGGNAGPSSSDGRVGGSWVGTGSFNVGGAGLGASMGGTVQALVPWLAVGVIAWLALRK